MRALGIASAIALTMVVGGTVAGVAVADDDTMPVPPRRPRGPGRRRGTRRATSTSVRAQLVLANQRLRGRPRSAAAQAAEACNGARWRAAAGPGGRPRRRAALRHRRGRRRAPARGVRRRAWSLLRDGARADRALARSRSPTASRPSSSARPRSRNAEDALDDHYDEFRASATLADVATQQAQDARAAADGRCRARRAPPATPPRPPRTPPPPRRSRSPTRSRG